MATSAQSATTRQGLINSYNQVIPSLEGKAAGTIRAAKGKLVEDMAQRIVMLAWRESGGAENRLTLGDTKRYNLPIKNPYIRGLPITVKKEINSKKKQYTYESQVDVHVFVDKELVMGVECKAYAETAMLKRILVDFQLLKSMHHELICCLFQLESMLGGDYSEPVKANTPTLGSRSSHTLMSYFPGVDLNIFTLLDGERKIERPIHNPAYFKELKLQRLNHVISQFKTLLTPLL